MLKYRKEIDGLRAVAVLPVLLYHAGLPYFPGGYIGVDIFFVISGYLITSIILSEHASNNFSLLSFYERRARRILPAISFLCICCSALALIILSSEDLKGFASSLMFVSVFLSNVFFYANSSYFSRATDELPMVHTWSLAVEEQFYLVFPLVIMALWPLGKRFILASILAIITCSLMLSQILSKTHIDANYYLITSRAWELAAGVCCNGPKRTYY